MILNTLDNLGKFEAKGDEGYFIGYSMSSKAFRVFNKRTRRVEENLHVEFLENKAIEQGAGPTWLFDIDSLTKSMNYVLVDAGTNSTNLSGTKDAANQEVKKNESSLRYIVLPNWAHDALLESTSMESPISTVSSPVPTACLNDSLEPSSEARLVSKRVANQEETPFLDNILSLKNRFSDVRSLNTPMDKENPWGKDGPGKDVELHLYRSMIGSLMYLTASKSDIMFAVCACARHQGHPKLGLWYPKASTFDLVAYSDSDYGGASQDLKSTTGGSQFLGR
nr:hypothetical protein [Tanacetum cinerariifolium]